MKLEINNKGGQMVKAPKVCPGKKPVKGGITPVTAPAAPAAAAAKVSEEDLDIMVED